MSLAILIILQAIAGGILCFIAYVIWPSPRCPRCGKRECRPYLRHDATHRHECLHCGKVWS